jgi:hypothetical protein
MDNINIKILGAINTLSSFSVVSPLEVNKKFKLNEIEFGDRLMSLKRLRYVNVERGDQSPGSSLPNGIYGVSITDDGRQYLRRGKYL